IRRRRAEIALRRPELEESGRAKSRREESPVCGADRSQHAFHPGRDLLRQQSPRREEAEDQCLSPADRRIPLQRRGQVHQRSERREGRSEVTAQRIKYRGCGIEIANKSPAAPESRKTEKATSFGCLLLVLLQPSELLIIGDRGHDPGRFLYGRDPGHFLYG